MARQVLPIVGAVVGAFYGNPQLGYFIGSVIGNAVDPQVIKGPKLGEAGLQTSAEGVFRPIVFGTGAVKGNVICRGNRQIKKKRERQGKGGPVSETERVYWTFAIRICEAKDESGGIALSRIWEDEKLVYDVTPDSQIIPESAEFAGRFRFYNGSETQLPDPDLEAFKGVGNVNAHRGTVYIVFPNYDLTDTGERIKDYRFEVSNGAGNPYTYAALLHMDEKTPDTGNLRDEISVDRWSPGGDLVPETSPFGINALEISGSGDVSSTQYDFASEIGVAPFCISGWINLNSDAPGQVSDTLLGHWYAPGTRAFQMNVRRGDAQNYYVQLSTDGTDIVSIQGDTVFPLDQWMYIAVTRDGSGNVRLFQGPMGGVCEKVGEGLFPYPIHSNPSGSLGGQWTIGGYDNAPLQNVLHGLVKEVVIIIGDPVYTAEFPAPTAPWPNPSSESSTRVALGDIVAELCARPGLSASRYDVTELTDMVDGLVLADDYTYADVIRTLMPVYFYGASEHDAGSGYKLHFPKHGKAVVTTLTIDDFVSVPDKTVRQDAFERPRVLHLHYQSPTVGYAPAKASPSRFSPDVKVVGEQSIQVPVSFKDQDEAWQRADKILKIVWTGIAGEEEFSLPMSFLYLVPTDAVGISLRGQVRRMVFSTQSYAAGVIESKLVADRQGNYTSTLTGITLPPPTPPPPSIKGPSIMAFGDWPALNDNNDRLLYYVGVTGQTEAWHGAQVDRSTDGGANFEQAATFSQNTIMGSLMADVTAASRYYTDTTNVIRVSLYLDDEIESLTDAQFNSEGGAFMLGTQAGWEMIQYRDAEQDTDGDWLLTHLKRGQLNTDPVAHAPGDMFVLLDGVQSVDAVTAWLNTDLTHRATSAGRSPDGVPTQTDEYTGASQREFPVASVSLSRNVDDITVSIIPRHRFGTESNPIRSINWERYTIEISDGSSVSVIGTTADTFTFDASAMSSPITVSVAQRNRLTGDGPIVSESIA